MLLFNFHKSLQLITHLVLINSCLCLKHYLRGTNYNIAYFISHHFTSVSLCLSYSKKQASPPQWPPRPMQVIMAYDRYIFGSLITPVIFQIDFLENRRENALRCLPPLSFLIGIFGYQNHYLIDLPKIKKHEKSDHFAISRVMATAFSTSSKKTNEKRNSGAADLSSFLVYTSFKVLSLPLLSYSYSICIPCVNCNQQNWAFSDI